MGKGTDMTRGRPVWPTAFVLVFAVALCAQGGARADTFYECVGKDGVKGFFNQKQPGQKCSVYLDFNAQPSKPKGSKCVVQRYRNSVFYKCEKNGVWYIFNRTEDEQSGSGGRQDSAASGGGSSAQVRRVVSSEEIVPGPSKRGPERVEGLDRMVKAAAAEFGIPEALLYAVIEVESGFNPDVVSPVGAQGLMQLMPVTADYLNLDNPFDPEQNVRAGAKLLRLLSDRFDGNHELVIAAYYTGAGNVQKAGNVVPRSCENYVARVMERYRKHLSK